MMRLHLLAGAALLAAPVTAALATPIDFGYTGSLVDFTVPTTGEYQILALGAQGGNAVFTSVSGPVTGPGGLGAEIGGDFSLTTGEALQIAVGGAGDGGRAPGGGGGSFVVGAGNTPLIIAGGGGGGGGMILFPVGPASGGPGLAGPDGGNVGNLNNGGTGGNGGLAGFVGGGGGGGFLSAGQSSDISDVGGGGAFPDLSGGLGGANGGFGGGGGAGANGGGGGGGGYSGGGGGPGSQMDGIAPGGGGGSFDAGIDQILMADFNAGNGEVVITSIPEPASLALLSAGLLGLAVLRRRRTS